MIEEIIGSLLKYVKNENSKVSLPLDHDIIQIFKGKTQQILETNHTSIVNAIQEQSNGNPYIKDFLENSIEIGIELTKDEEDLSSMFNTSYTSKARQYSKNNSTNSKVSHIEYL